MKISAIGRTGRRSAIVAALAVIIPACGPASDDGVAPSVPRIKSSRALGTTRGPNGEPPTPNSALRLSSSEVAKVRAGRCTAHSSSPRARTSPMPSTPACAMSSACSGSGWSPRQARTSTRRNEGRRRDGPGQAAVGLVDASRRSRRDRIGVQAAARRGTKIVLLSSVPQGMTYGRTSTS